MDFVAAIPAAKEISPKNFKEYLLLRITDIANPFPAPMNQLLPARPFP